MSARRSFFKKGVTVILGGLVSFLAIPQLVKPSNLEVSAIGDKQLRLLLASKVFLEKTGMLRAMSIFHFANDGQIETDWSVVIPREDDISPDTDNLARQVLALFGQ